jgi:hypothetical protein
VAVAVRALLAGSAERLSLERYAGRAQAAFQKALRNFEAARQSGPVRLRVGP